MRVSKLDGTTTEWKIKGNLLHQCLSRQARSSYHLQARQLLHELFPTMQIYEEVPIPTGQFLDFYIPIKKLALEVHGEQHYKYVPFFHQSQMGFVKHKQNDSKKEEWCDANGIQLIILAYNESIDNWRERLT
jgi:very-short-patch-repair endonuclease